MKNYRLIEIAPKDGKRDGRRIRTTVFEGPDKTAFKRALEEYYRLPRKPWRETAYYYGKKRIWAYEI